MPLNESPDLHYNPLLPDLPAACSCAAKHICRLPNNKFQAPLAVRQSSIPPRPPTRKYSFDRPVPLCRRRARCLSDKSGNSVIETAL